MAEVISHLHYSLLSLFSSHWQRLFQLLIGLMGVLSRIGERTHMSSKTQVLWCKNTINPKLLIVQPHLLCGGVVQLINSLSCTHRAKKRKVGIQCTVCSCHVQAMGNKSRSQEKDPCFRHLRKQFGKTYQDMHCFFLTVISSSFLRPTIVHWLGLCLQVLHLTVSNCSSRVGSSTSRSILRSFTMGNPQLYLLSAPHSVCVIFALFWRKNLKYCNTIFWNLNA